MLGDRERVVALLREAFERGVPHDAAVHAAIDFEPLRDYGAFHELLRPKG